MQQQQKIIFLEAKWMFLLRVILVTALLVSWKNAVAVQSCQCLPQNSGWFDHVWNMYNDIRVKTTFRLSKATFSFILGQIEHDL